MRTPLLLALVLGTVLAAAPAAAQAEGRIGRSERLRTSVPSYYFFHQPGEATIQVAVEGSVQNPGLYEVALGTDLGRLLALAGGPRLEPRERRTARTVEVRLFRPVEGMIYATTFQDFAVNTAAYPPLREGDRVLVEVIQRQGFAWQDVFTVAGGLSALAIIFNALSN